MNDYVLNAIDCGFLNKDNISFSSIHSRFKKQKQGVHDQLKWGRAIINSVDQLNQYLHSYGDMTRKQWKEIFSKFLFKPDFLQIIDYGCGQGLASALLFDEYGKDLRINTKSITLIEPSTLALRRAEAIVRCYCPESSILSFNDFVGRVRFEDLSLIPGVEFAHIFSNVLDIPGFDGLSVFRKILKTKGVHNIFAVSHDRNFFGGSWVFDEIIKIIDESFHIGVDHKDIYNFKVSVSGGYSDMIGLFCQLEVLGE